MAYSFTIKAETKALALAAVTAEFNAVIQGRDEQPAEEGREFRPAMAAQPEHETDREAVIAAATSFVALLPDDETTDVAIGINGYKAKEGEPPEESEEDTRPFRIAAFTVVAHLVKKRPPEAT